VEALIGKRPYEEKKALDITESDIKSHVIEPPSTESINKDTVNNPSL
jgi:hypothetical protein